jgi:hypothetical protein
MPSTITPISSPGYKNYPDAKLPVFPIDTPAPPSLNYPCLWPRVRCDPKLGPCEVCFMLKLTLTGLILLSAVVLGGCQTVTSDPTQETQKYSRIADLNRRMLADDMDAFWLLDKPSRLSRWNVRSTR